MTSPTMALSNSSVVPARPLERLVGAALVMASLVYLSGFVNWAWIPHDEGLIGQSADFVLNGARPHVGYEDSYTGGLSYVYAAVFRVAGVDLLHIRWLMFAGAALATIVSYALVRRCLRPLAAGVVAWAGLTWGFPNYFSGLPSWWLLICALVASWAYVRFVETDQLRYLVGTCLAAGTALLVKQTGLYVVIAVALVVLYDWRSSASGKERRLVHFALATAALISTALVVLIMGSRSLTSDGIYLLVPVATFTLAQAFCDPDVGPGHHGPLKWLTAIGALALPMSLFLLPYLVDRQLSEFFTGAVIEPRQRLAFANLSMPNAGLAVLSSAPLLSFGFVAAKDERSQLEWLWWALAVCLPIAALFDITPYQIVWQPARAVIAALPMASAWFLHERGASPNDRRILRMLAALTAWLALNQFPYAAPIYFSYYAPLGLVGLVVLLRSYGFSSRRLAPWGLMLVAFGAFVTNPGFIGSLGIRHSSALYDAPLELPRAHLMVAEGQASQYRRVVDVVGQHLGSGRLVAGPDCPEIYFLAGRRNPTGRMFEFLSQTNTADVLTSWSSAQVLVINHYPEFSAPLPDVTLEQLRSSFPRGLRLPQFEVRWR